MSRIPACANALPITAPSSPRPGCTSSDSCGLSIAGVISVAVFSGFLGSVMSTTITPNPSRGCMNTSVGNSRVESKKAQMWPVASL